MFSAQGGPVCTWSLICSLVFEVVMMQRYSHLYLLLPSHSLPDLRIFFFTASVSKHFWGEVWFLWWGLGTDRVPSHWAPSLSFNFPKHAT